MCWKGAATMYPPRHPVPPGPRGSGCPVHDDPTGPRGVGMNRERDRVDPPPDWATLQGAIAGEVVLPGTTAYDHVHRPFNARFHDVRPQAVVRCATPEDVSETITFLARHSVESAARSGGDCFSGGSSTRGGVLDVPPLGGGCVSRG